MHGEGSSTSSDQFISLKRDTPWKTQIATAGIIGTVLLLIGSLILYLAYSHRHEEPLSESWVTVAVGGGFALLGLLMEYAAIHQFFASRLPEAEAAIDQQSLHPGDTFCLRICQPGPVQLKSLSAKLVCEVSVRHKQRNAKTGEKAYYYTSSYPCQLNIFRTGEKLALAGDRIEQVAEGKIPGGAEPSSQDEKRKVVWRIELWGEVVRGADFMHPYTIEVSGQ